VEDLTQLAKQSAAAREAKATLDKTPADPAANLVLGKYYCFFKDDWPRGVPMLALSGAEGLSQLAQDELVADSSAEKLAVADGWYTASEKEKGASRTALRRHAHALYLANVSSLSGLAAKKIAQRIEELERELPTTTAAPKVEVLRVFQGHTAAAFSPDTRSLLTSDASGGLHVWNLPGLREVRSFNGKRPAFAIGFTNDGSRILTFATDKLARLFDADTGAELRSFEIADDEGFLWISPDNQRAYLLSERVWSYVLGTGKVLQQSDSLGANQITGKNCSRDGRFVIASGVNNNVRITDLTSAKSVALEHKVHTYGSWISADGKTALTCGGDAIVRLWNVGNQSLITEYKGAQGHLYSAAMTADGRRVLACGGGDKSLHVWDAKSGQELHVYRIGAGVNRLQVSPDGQYAVCSSGGIALVGLPK
jgi:WD40 repeat protein